jgi:mRNA interferase HigB
LGKMFYICTMRVITKKRLNDFTKQYPDARASLKFWYDTVTENSFYAAQEVIQLFNTADYVGNERIVFNIARNKYRLIAKFKFHPRAQIVYVRFLGTHTEYDKITDITNV